MYYIRTIFEWKRLKNLLKQATYSFSLVVIKIIVISEKPFIKFSVLVYNLAII